MQKALRHFRCKCLLSQQWLCDSLPESRKQGDVFLVFKGQSKKKLEEIHRDCDVGLELEDFQDIYNIATKKDFSFLYIDTKASKFRQNFDRLFSNV